MKHLRSALPLLASSALAAVSSTLSASADPAAPAAARAQTAGPDVIAVNTRGTAPNESTDPSRVKYTFPLYSLVTHQQIGTGTDDATCVSSTPPPCAVVGARPTADTIVSATGAFAGRTGRVRLSGGDDMHQFPMTLIQDDFWVIELS